MSRFEISYYFGKNKNKKFISREGLVNLIDKVRSLEKEEEESSLKKERRIFGIPDQIISRKERCMKRIKVKKMIEEYLKHHTQSNTLQNNQSLGI